MRQTLEVQLAAAENEIKSAEQEKLEKENAAHKLFVDQELVMEKVVQESKNLKQLAEENAKVLTPLSTWFLDSITCDPNLNFFPSFVFISQGVYYRSTEYCISVMLQLQEFLTDRGHTVDALQYVTFFF